MIRSIKFGYDDSEDRIFAELATETERTTFLWTRRLMRRFIGSMAKLLANSNPVMAHTPFDSRKEVIIFEHQMAIQDGALVEQNAAARPVAEVPAEDLPNQVALLRKVNIEVQPNHFDMMLSDGGAVGVSLAISRMELHRILATIHRLSRTAEWDLEQEASWLTDALVGVAHPSSACS